MLLNQGLIKDHPEYFAVDAGGTGYAARLCTTNPDVAKIVAENVLEYLKEKPHAEIISISKNDNAGDQICHARRARSSARTKAAPTRPTSSCS